jgi:hypothetical protein
MPVPGFFWPIGGLQLLLHDVNCMGFTCAATRARARVGGSRNVSEGETTDTQ